MDDKITCPESLAINFCDRHYGIGADGIVMIEKSEIADAKMRVFNRDGSDGGMAANPVRCVAKYLYDNRIVNSETITVETCCGVKELAINSFNGVATSASVNLGKATFDGKEIPSTFNGKMCNKTINFNGKDYNVTLVNVGIPHCIIFCDKVDEENLEELGQFVNDTNYFPRGIFVNCVRVVNNITVKMRVWTKDNYESLSCGTAAAAAVAAAVENGYCLKDQVVTAKLKGGDLFVKCNSNGDIEVDGSVKQSYEGVIEI